MNDLLKPSVFASIEPMSSIAQKCESETVARNIMVIRSRLGNKWPLKWCEYKAERQKDGNFTMSEKTYFDEVYPQIETAIDAIAFSPSWAKAAKKAIK